MKSRIFTIFGIIKDTVRPFFCSNEKNWKSVTSVKNVHCPEVRNRGVRTFL